jgi:hypothetical protein
MPESNTDRYSHGYGNGDSNGNRYGYGNGYSDIHAGDTDAYCDCDVYSNTDAYAYCNTGRDPIGTD